MALRALPVNAESGDFSVTHNKKQQPAFLADLRERDACGVGFIANLKGVKSNDVLQKGLQALSCNEHRGGCNYDDITGDGAGVSTQVPWKLISKWAKRDLDEDKTVVGTFFLQQDEFEKSQKIIDEMVKDSKFKLIGWREVPVHEDTLGPMARDAQPKIFHLVIEADDIPEDRVEPMAYILRKKIEIKLDS